MIVNLEARVYCVYRVLILSFVAVQHSEWKKLWRRKYATKAGLHAQGGAVMRFFDFLRTFRESHVSTKFKKNC